MGKLSNSTLYYFKCCAASLASIVLPGSSTSLQCSILFILQQVSLHIGYCLVRISRICVLPCFDLMQLLMMIVVLNLGFGTANIHVSSGTLNLLWKLMGRQRFGQGRHVLQISYSKRWSEGFHQSSACQMQRRRRCNEKYTVLAAIRCERQGSPSANTKHVHRCIKSSMMGMSHMPRSHMPHGDLGLRR
jgi:hypothetical protein